MAQVLQFVDFTLAELKTDQGVDRLNGFLRDLVSQVYANSGTLGIIKPDANIDLQGKYDVINPKTKPTTTTTTAPSAPAAPAFTVTTEQYSGSGWAVTWLVLNSKVCWGTGYVSQGNNIQLATGFSPANMTWSGSVRTIFGYLNPGDALLSLDFLIPDGGNTCTLCRTMKSNDADTWRTDNCVGQFVGIGHQ
jgi:hypothetical protein